MKCLPVLIVEDDRDLLDALCATLKLAGYPVLAATDGVSALSVLERQRAGLVVSDVQMKPMDGISLLHEIKALYPALPVLLMTAFGVVEKAVAAMRAGACDYLLKPFEPNSLLELVARYMMPEAQDETLGMVAEDPRSGSLLALAQRVAKSSATVLLTGESGSGKEVIARFIHANSPRADKPFVAINCAAIPENLLEATLFGYEKGAFTGAAQAQAGKFEQAQGGTLLLDEVSEIPLALQAKLLRVLQEREVERVGGRKTIQLDIRLLATSNRDMQAMVAGGAFREDLYYRLNVFPLQVPPLRERPRDIVPLARHFLARLAGEFDRHGLKLSQAAETKLLQYSWPGNVRELENVVQRAMILAPGNTIEAEHLSLAEAPPAAAAAAPAVALEPKDDSASAGAPIDMKSLERAHIMETLAAVNGSRKQAVKRLGISERTLRYKLQQYRLTEAAG